MGHAADPELLAYGDLTNERLGAGQTDSGQESDRSNLNDIIEPQPLCYHGLYLLASSAKL